jgi:deoxyribodipyrimidine photolyase-related protein
VNSYFEEAIDYVNTHFNTNIGKLHQSPIYPTTFDEAERWLQQFFKTRIEEFGVYEDTIVNDQHFLNHSVLSPLINVGLLTPSEVLSEVLDYANSHNIPINSLEGFIRQILGWREFIRGVYEVKGSEERIKNFWNHSQKIPASFYSGTTGILPIDQTIKKILKTGYAHHIERLMVLGNFMLLCEFDPDSVYQWFMELFIDAYDWVMVPNVYGMSLYADGGIMSTKPYISSSNYIKKMSDYPNGNWQTIWDGLFWRFMDKHRSFFSKNPRLNMLVGTLDKMSDDKKFQHLKIAENFLASLYNNKDVQLNL